MRQEIWEENILESFSTLSALARFWAHGLKPLTRLCWAANSLVSAEDKIQAREGSLDATVPCSRQGFQRQPPFQPGQTLSGGGMSFLGLPAYHPCSPV